MNPSVKQKQSQGHREQTGCFQGGSGWQRVEVGVWDQKMRTGKYRMNGQQSPTVQHREPYSISCEKS